MSTGKHISHGYPTDRIEVSLASKMPGKPRKNVVSHLSEALDVHKSP